MSIVGTHASRSIKEKSETRKLVTQVRALYRFYDFKRSIASNGTSHGRRDAGCSIGSGKVFFLLLLAAARSAIAKLPSSRRPRAIHGEFIWHSGQGMSEITVEGCVAK